MARPASRWRWLAAGVLMLAVVGWLTGRGGSHLPAATSTAPMASGSTADVTPGGTPSASALSPGTGAVVRGSAVLVLRGLAVKGRAPLTGFTRAMFGPAWEDVNDNGCDTRDDVLAAQLTSVVLQDACRVRSGTVADPYTGRALRYLRGHSSVDIDHVVALGNAWQTGAQQLSAATRAAFANDPLNLLAVSASANRAKGDSDAASWLPGQRSYRCAYVARQVAVKGKYRLWTTRAENTAIALILARCPEQIAPTAGAGPSGAPPTSPVAPRTPSRSSPPSTPSAPRRHSATPTRSRGPSDRQAPPVRSAVVHPGAFCSWVGDTGVTDRGAAMVCGPASDGRNRWHHG